MTGALDFNSQYTPRDIALTLIDEPARAERETMDEGYLAELAISIGEVGLIEPLIVKTTDDRFQVISGHRRLLACRIAQYTPVPCRVRAGADIDDLAVLVAENAFREDVNAIEEARFYQRLFVERCESDVDILCALVRRKRGHVEDRLNLLRGYAPVIEALHQRRISIAAARELNKCSDANRMLILLDTAQNQGATARQIAEWRRDADALGVIPIPYVDPADAAAAAATATGPHAMQCVFCHSPEYVWMMDMVYLHKPCADMLRKLLGS